MTEPATAGDEPVVVYPLLEDSGNQRVLREWLTSHGQYVVVDDKPMSAAAFDVCIVDQPALIEHSESIQAARAAAKPVLLPVLLLVSDLESELLGTDQSRLSDTVFETTVDELLSVPIRQAELEWRLQALVRLRNQSLDLQAQTEQLRQFKQAVEASGHAIWMSDVDGTIQYVNPAFESITGYSREEIVGESPEILNSGAMDDDYYDELWETITAGNTWREEITNQRSDGSLYIAEQTIAPIIEHGEPAAFIAVQTDVTDRKQLRDVLKQYRDIVQRLDDPIMLQNCDGTFRLVNDALCEFAGLNESELLGRDEYAFMDAKTATAIDRYKKRVIETGQPVEYSVDPTFEQSDKEAIFYTSRYPHYDDTGELIGTLAICRDVTDLEERTRQLHVLDNILRHNIRNSLNVIHGRGEQLREAVDGELESAAAVIVDRAEDLLTTSEKSRAITAVLSEASEPRPQDLGQLVCAVADEAATNWPGADIGVTGPERLVVSITTAETVLKELLTNAVIHNDHDEPRVRIELGVDGSRGTLSVRDNGPGLSEFDRRVLESGGAIKALSHGSGLGLWLVYWIVKRSGGSIRVDDCDPRGTEITIRLPLAASTD